MTDMQSQYHDLDKRLALVEAKIITVAELSKVAHDLKTELAEMKAFSKGRNKVLGIWCAATGVVCTGLFMLGQVILQRF